MLKDRRTQWATVSESVGFLGVIGSLVFVGYQVRQNTLALRAAAVQESISVARQQTQMLATNPELVRIGMSLDRGEAVSEVEAAQHRWVLASFFWGMQGVFRQWQLGVLPDEEWSAWRRVICRNMASPSIQAYWESDGSDIYIPAFRAEVEGCRLPIR